MEYTLSGKPLTDEYIANAVKQFENLTPDQLVPIEPWEEAHIAKIVASLKAQRLAKETEAAHHTDSRIKVPA